MPLPSGYDTKEEWNAYQRKYRRRKIEELKNLKARLKELEAVKVE
jgi:hypothetical protein